MNYQGQAVSLIELGNDFVELVFDQKDAPVNTLNAVALRELSEIANLLESSQQLRGVLISSNKPSFIAGADITEFQAHFSRSEAELGLWFEECHKQFSLFESLACPSVAMINSLALGGGVEIALAADFRVVDDQAKLGMPEVSLGICPGWGGTVRLARLAGPETALSWIMTGKPQGAKTALQAGVVDQQVPSDALRSAAIALLEKASSGEIDYLQNRRRKLKPLEESRENLERLKDLHTQLSANLDDRYPAAGKVLNLLMEQSFCTFEEAIRRETRCLISLAKSSEAQSLIGLYLNDRSLKRSAKHWSEQAEPVAQGAVLGAGIMGGGVAFQSASTGTPILMKDIQQSALELGINTASGLLDKQIKKGRITAAKKENILARIQPQLSYQGFETVDLVVEAVVENAKVKAAVLSEVEQQLPKGAVLTSNTSTISITHLAESLQRPEQFCGMHFFNPVHLMPLVEVIRGKHSSDQTIARTVAYASSMGKVPIVVNDCPGFLVNRVLFPYFNGFNRLLQAGVDFERVDSVMEQFGWPMGPAYLADVVGLDTMVHADQVMQQGFPDRMLHEEENIIETLLAEGALGQKNGRGFYRYSKDDNGRMLREPSEQAKSLLTAYQQADALVSDQMIVEMMMIPMCTEAMRCLEEGVVSSAAEVDMGMILGLGFPRFRGGPLKYVDIQGLAQFAETVGRYQHLGGLYQLTEILQKRIDEGRTFYS